MFVCITDQYQTRMINLDRVIFLRQTEHKIYCALAENFEAAFVFSTEEEATEVWDHLKALLGVGRFREIAGK